MPAVMNNSYNLSIFSCLSIITIYGGSRQKHSIWLSSDIITQYIFKALLFALHFYCTRVFNNRFQLRPFSSYTHECFSFSPRIEVPYCGQVKAIYQDNNSAFAQRFSIMKACIFLSLLTILFFCSNGILGEYVLN